jgi:high affinity Mn2+ porin
MLGLPLARQLVFAAALIALSVPVCAADGGSARTASFSDSYWNGAYVGGHFGAEWGQSNWTADAEGTSQIGGRLGLGNPFDFSAGTGSYFQGLQAGYNLEFPSGIVLGVEGDVSFLNTLSGTQSFTPRRRCSRI